MIGVWRALLVAATIPIVAAPPDGGRVFRPGNHTSDAGRDFSPGDADRTFTRLVAPFEVLDAEGRPYDLPFLGGLDVPRPQFVDIDGDGDLDLFLQEYSNELKFFENTGTRAAPRYEWRTDRYQDIAIGEWYRLVDIDADGLLDLLSELPFSRINFHRNAGTRTKATFAPAVPLQDASGEPLFFDRQNIPALVDLDCDRRLDLFVGRVEGTVTHYEAVAPGAAQFAFITEFWEGIEIIGGVGDFGSMRHGANAISFADFDDDRDLDLFWGDFFEAGVLVIENIGRTCSTPSFQVDPYLLPADGVKTSGYNAPAPVDYDGDGDLDFLMGVIGGAFNPIATAADNFYFWERTGEFAFELRTRRLLHGIDLGSETSPAVGDLDGDGDLDIIVGNKIDPEAGDAARLVLFWNEGTSTAPRFRQGETLRLTDAYHLAPALGDLDGDGDLDMIAGTWNTDLLYFRNDGTRTEPRWVADETGNIHPPRVSNSMPALADIDNDGDLDLFIGQSNGEILFYRNTGTPKAAQWELVTDRLAEIKVGRRSAPALADVDADGLLDLVIGREEGGHVVYRNSGTRTEPLFTEAEPLAVPLPRMAAPQFVDLDGDGVLDILTGSVSGGLLFYRGGMDGGGRGFRLR